MSDPVASLGSIDAGELHSSVTLLHGADPQAVPFPSVLNRYSGGLEDSATPGTPAPSRGGS